MKFKKLICLILFLTLCQCKAIYCNTDTVPSLDSYLEFLDQNAQILGPKGNSKSGEIEIIHDKKKIMEIEKSSARKVGIIYKDKYWIWLNDAVQFPNQTYGIYGRILWVNSLKGPPGVAVMPVLPNGDIVLIRNFRHATRSWEYELPKGGINPNESPEIAATREVEEETGMIIEKLQLLGNIAIDSGILTSVEPLYMAKVVRNQKPTHEDGEAIASIDAFSKTELMKGLKDGFLSVTIEGKMQKVPLRDPTLAYALLLSEL